MLNINRRLLTVILFVLSYIIYILTTAPGLTFTDSGELAGVCSTLGVAHPTGYPLFTLLGYLWTLLPLPFSNVYALNLFTGFLTAASVSVFFNWFYILIKYLHSIELTANKKKSKSKNNKKLEIKELDSGALKIISFISALIFAFAGIIWQQATAIEVYALHILLMNLILLFFIKGLTNGEKPGKYFLLTALFLGLGFSNHMTTILVLPAVLFLFFKRPGERFTFNAERLKSFAFLLIPFFIGLSLYLFLVMRSASLPDFNWGWISRGFDKFYYHVSGKQFQIWMFSGENLSENLGRFFTAIPSQVCWLGIIPLLLGIGKLFKLSRTLFFLFFINLLVCVLYAINYSIHDIESYFILAIISLVAFTGAGLYSIAVHPGVNVKLLPLFVIIPIALCARNYSANDMSDDYMVEEYTRILTENLDSNAVIISSQWDYWVSAFWYKQKVENYRPDIVLVEKELLRRTWYPEQFKKWYPETYNKVAKEFELHMKNLELFESGEKYDNIAIQQNFLNLLEAIIATNIDERPVYVTSDIWNDGADKSIGSKYAKVPRGFAIKLEKEKKSHPINMDKIDVSKLAESIQNNEGHLVDGIKQSAIYNLADLLGNYYIKTGQKEQAIKAFEAAYTLWPENKKLPAIIQKLSNQKEQN